MFDELKIRYKELTLTKRLMLCALLGLLPALFIYTMESSEIDEEHTLASEQESAAAAKLLKADNQLKNLEKTESELNFTKEQLKLAETRLPDNVAMDEVLRTIGKTAKDMSMNVRLFEPQPEVVRGEEYKYSEIPMKISVEAHDYGQICEWLDKVAGIKTKMYLRSWAMSRRLPAVTEMLESGIASAGIQSLSPSVMAEREGKATRDKLVLVLEGEFSMFKLATPEQIAALAPVDPKAKPADGTTSPKQNQEAKPASHSAVDQDAKAGEDRG